VEYLQKRYGGDTEITVCTYDPTSAIIRRDGVRFVSYFPNRIRSHFFRNIVYFFHNIWLIGRADLLIVGGGGILFDNEPGISFAHLYWQWRIRVWLARLFHTTVCFWGISLEITLQSNQLELPGIFHSGDQIAVRDERSQYILHLLSIPSEVIRDIVFLYDAPTVDRSHLPDRLVGISLRGGFLSDVESTTVSSLYDMLVTDGYKPVFLVFSTEGETAQNDIRYIASIMGDRPYNTTKNIKQTLDLYPWLHMVIGMRLHAGILACVHEIPYLPISYGPKTDELVRLLGLSDIAIPRGGFTPEVCIQRWSLYEKNYTLYQETMRMRHREIRAELQAQLEKWG
jgi:polysaccharide pyruvyl transferase WcaK-like protein